jgi:hypothetical protein
MEITLKYAYELTKEALEGFCISCCYELEDCYIFITPCDKLRNPVFFSPIKIPKDGSEADFWDNPFMNCFERAQWLNTHGKFISLEELNKLDT